jgi:hypothetical protein
VSTLLSWWLACAPPDATVAVPTSAPGSEAGPPVAAVPEHLGLGRPADPARIAAWDRDVDAQGNGLPAGRGTVAEGEVLYTQLACAGCHGLAGEGGIAPKLVGTDPATGFGEQWRGHERTIGNWWPHATTVFDYLQRAMPQTAPGSLTPDQTYALTAFLLARNGAVPQDFVADATSLPAVKMPTKIIFVPDDREQTAAFR